MCCWLAEEQALCLQGAWPSLHPRLPITGAGSGMRRRRVLDAGLQAAHPRRGSRAAPASLG